MSAGYIYRVATAGVERIHELVADYIGYPCGQVGGTILWDVRDPPKLRCLVAAGSAAELKLTGDFGHIFAGKAELRWKRRDDGGYDPLLFREQEVTPGDATPPGGSWTTREIRLIEQGDARRQIRAVEYCAPNGAVQFLRYKEMPR